MPTPELCGQFAQYILNRHNQAGVAEADIRASVRDFLIETGLAEREAIDMEQSPASGWSGRVDLRTRDIIIEFKVRIGDQINPSEQNVAQLDDYLKAAVDGGRPQRFGILTDGKYWILRWPGMGPVRTQPPNAFTLSSAEHGLLLYEWLRDQSQALEERGVAPTDEDVKARLGDGPRFEAHIRALTELYEANRDDPTIALKRDLWRSLLAAALGQVVEEEPDLDRLFVRHTYLSVVVGLALQSSFEIDVLTAATNRPSALLGGELFIAKTGVSGVVDSDFFTWPIEIGGERWLRDLARRIDRFDWSRSESDIARVLYEAVIPAEDRKRLGEYYTPAWLATMIVDAVVTDPLNQQVLDPACGSGTFIFAAVSKYVDAARAEGWAPTRTLDGLLSHVVGIDVHPVAVHLARATWTFAAREAIREARNVDPHHAVSVPVYLGDSLQLKSAEDIFSRDKASLPVKIDDASGAPRNFTLDFPLSLVEMPDWFEPLLAEVVAHIHAGLDPAIVLEAETGIEGSDFEMLSETVATLQRLHDDGQDHIWAYYAKNLVRPLVLRRHKVDAIVGNPPWMTYHQTEAELRSSLETLSKSRYGIWTGGLYAKHQDLSSLFFTRCVDLYLKPGGHIGMVMPHSALQAGQFMKWRSGAWTGAESDLGQALPWDLERIRPIDFFPLPACVVFAKKSPTDVDSRTLPRQAVRFTGDAGGPLASAEVALYPTEAGFASPYADKARVGAVLFPRALIFVNENQDDANALSGATPVSPRRSSQEKEPWKSLELTELQGGRVEREHLWDVHTGNTIAPYLALEPRKAVIPIAKDRKIVQVGGREIYGVTGSSLLPQMRRRWQQVNEIYLQNRNENSERSLAGQIDYFGQLTAQRKEGSELWLVYGASGAPTAAWVAGDIVVDYKLIWIRVDSKGEGDYLSGIINSAVLEERVRPLMPKGQFGARDVVKHLWRLPIPEYDDSDSLHVAIAQAGEDAAAGAKALWDGIRAEREAKGQSTSVTVARREIRKWLSESAEGHRVEELVSRLLG